MEAVAEAVVVVAAVVVAVAVAGEDSLRVVAEDLVAGQAVAVGLVVAEVGAVDSGVEALGVAVDTERLLTNDDKNTCKIELLTVSRAGRDGPRRHQPARQKTLRVHCQ